jgi:CPA2 family monovalent cation:H+ antiporter-2
VARGEFSIVIAGLAVAAQIEPRLGALVTAYVLLLVIIGPLTARYTEPIAKRLTRRPARRAARPETRPSGAGQPTAVLSDHPPGQ